ncbi:MAG: hypothetical protein MSH30_04750, partial [Campylobacter sp.]|nr:hypothetical protein [Campylobacter sp.]
FLGVFYIKNTIKRTQTEHKTKNTATFLPQNKTISNFQRINFPSLSASIPIKSSFQANFFSLWFPYA